MTLADTERETLIRHYFKKAQTAVENTDFLIINEKYSLAINQCYYGIFYMLSALALRDGFKTSKHEQLIGWFNKTYILYTVIT